MTDQPTSLFDRRAGQVVPAVLHTGLSIEQILAVEAVWGPERAAAVERLLREGFPEDRMPQHWHWDWGRKVPKLGSASYLGVGVSCEGAMQGLMLLARDRYHARLAPDAGEGVVYIDYLESAPWNVRPLAAESRYGAAGLTLVRAAVEISVAEGFGGRVGLHSLPQAYEFYERTCGMVSLGADAAYEGLPCFELTRAGAAALLSRGGRT